MISITERQYVSTKKQKAEKNQTETSLYINNGAFARSHQSEEDSRLIVLHMHFSLTLSHVKSKH